MSANPYMLAFLGWQNHIETGKLTASIAYEQLPVSHLAVAQGGFPWQAPRTEASFTVETSGLADFQAFGLFRTNLTATAAIRWTAGMEPGDETLFDSGVLPCGVAAGYGQTLPLVLRKPISAKVVTCRISDNNNPDGFLRIGLAFVGAGALVRQNFEYGWKLGFEHTTEIKTSRSGMEYAHPLHARRVGEFGFPTLDQEQFFSVAMEIDRLRGDGGSVLIVPRPDQVSAARETIFGRVTEAGLPSNTSHLRWEWRRTIKERL